MSLWLELFYLKLEEGAPNLYSLSTSSYTSLEA